MEGQNHPLYSIDRDHVNRLITVKDPTEEDMVEIARLLMRYEGFPGAKDIQIDMLKVLKVWGLTKEELNGKTRKIWMDGYKSSSASDEIVGSGFDTSDKTVN